MKSLPVDPFIDSIAPFVTSLMRSEKGKRPEAIGTALLVEARGAHFLITAAHVVRKAKHLWFFPGPRGAIPVVGKGRASSAGGAPTGSDRIDIAVFRLAERLPQPYEFWRPVDIAALRNRSSTSSDNRYVFVGYPATKVKVNPANKIVDLERVSLNSTTEAVADVYQRLGLDPTIHLILRLDRKPIQSKGRSWQFPDPHGLSGSPVWSIDEHGPLVVGILIEYHKAQNVIVATRINHVLPLLENAERDYALSPIQKPPASSDLLL